MGIGEAEVVEAVEEPGCAGGLVEGWGGDVDEFELPFADLGLVEMQPVKGAMNCGESGEMADATLSGGRGGHQYSTSTRQGVGNRE